jgi:antitoxin ParD1/3/4
MTAVTISLPESLKKFVDAQLASKGYGNVSEYFRSLLREAQAREEDARLRTLLLEGLASDRIPLTDAFWTDMKAQATQLLRAQPREQTFSGNTATTSTRISPTSQNVPGRIEGEHKNQIR